VPPLAGFSNPERQEILWAVPAHGLPGYMDTLCVVRAFAAIAAYRGRRIWCAKEKGRNTASRRKKVLDRWGIVCYKYAVSFDGFTKFTFNHPELERTRGIPSVKVWCTLNVTIAVTHVD